MNILYCDDRIEDLEYFEKIFNDCALDDNLTLSDSPEQLLLEENNDISVFILDIDYNDKVNGLDYASMLIEKFPLSRIIYLTSYTEKFVEEAFINNQKVCAFMKKPVSAEILKKALNKAKREIIISNQTLTIKPVNKKLAIINLCDILYIESDGPRLNVVTKNETFTVRDKLSNIAKHLSPGFVSCHKSFIVNMNNISSLSNNEISMINGTCIPISYSKRQFFTDKYFEFLILEKEKCYA